MGYEVYYYLSLSPTADFPDRKDLQWTEEELSELFDHFAAGQMNDPEYLYILFGSQKADEEVIELDVDGFQVNGKPGSMVLESEDVLKR